MVSDGIDTCTVGRLSPVYNNLLDHLDGRLGQIVEFLKDSLAPTKIAANRRHKGVAMAVLIDRFVAGDGLINELLESYDSPVESDEN